MRCLEPEGQRSATSVLLSAWHPVQLVMEARWWQYEDEGPVTARTETVILADAPGRCQ